MESRNRNHGPIAGMREIEFDVGKRKQGGLAVLSIDEGEPERVVAHISRQDHPQRGPGAGPANAVRFEFEAVGARDFVFREMSRGRGGERDCPEIDRGFVHS